VDAEVHGVHVGRFEHRLVVRIALGSAGVGERAGLRLVYVRDRDDLRAGYPPVAIRVIPSPVPRTHDSDPHRFGVLLPHCRIRESNGTDA